MSEPITPIAVIRELLLRALGEAFPTTPFHIYSETRRNNHVAVVKWVDGPATEFVQEITRLFEGRRLNSGERTPHLLDGELTQFDVDYVEIIRTISNPRWEEAFKLVSDVSPHEYLLTQSFCGPVLASPTAVALALANPFLHAERR